MRAKLIAIGVSVALGATTFGLATANAADHYGRYIDVGNTKAPLVVGSRTWEVQTGFSGGTAASTDNIAAYGALDPGVAKTILQSPSAFTLAVPNGRYHVSVYAIAPLSAPLSVYAEDARRATVGSTKAAGATEEQLVRVRSLTATVKDGALDLKFDPAEKINITALTIEGTVTATSGGDTGTTSTTKAPTTTTSTPSDAAPTSTTTPTSTTVPATTGATPAAPFKVCGVSSLLTGPATAPTGAITVPAGDNSGVDFKQTGKTFWFAPGTHTVGNDEFAQIQPGNNTTFVGAPGAIVDGKKVARYAFTTKATNVTVKYLTIQNFVAPGDEGVVNHDAGAGWTISNNLMQANSGGAVFAGDNTTVSYNCLIKNGQYGFQVFGSGGVLDHNEIAGNNTDDFENLQPGCGCSGGGKFWDARNIKVTNNYVHDNQGPGLFADTNNANFLIQSNWIENNDGQAIIYETSYNAAIRNNVFKHNLLATGQERIKDGDPFTDAAIYVSESGGDTRVPYTLVGSGTIDIASNIFEDNYNGVSLWENADRYCNSPNNTSTGYCTLVNPTLVKTTSCTANNIAKAPYYDDCRWKTQNVKIHNNTFKMNPANFFNCKPEMCGRNAIFSNYGTSPSWSPYTGDKVQQALTFNQGNVFSSNTYIGPWHFAPFEPNRLIDMKTWQAAPYSQDKSSTLQ